MDVSTNGLPMVASPDVVVAATNSPAMEAQTPDST
jgi:hypothetical protein